MLGALSMNTQGPDDASMMTILEHGTPHQKEKFLKPLLNGEKRICYSMTEKAAGAALSAKRGATSKIVRAGLVTRMPRWRRMCRRRRRSWWRRPGNCRCGGCRRSAGGWSRRRSSMRTIGIAGSTGAAAFGRGSTGTASAG